MKIAISSSGKNLDAQLDPRFGRCAYFLIVDPADMHFEVFDNQSAARGSGAGNQAAQFLAGQNVDAILTGHVGPNAVQTLAAAGIDIFTEQRGGIEEVVNRYKSGALESTTQSTVSGHFGMGGGTGTRSRRVQRQLSGGGRRTRQGGGRGMGRGSGRRMEHCRTGR